MSLKGKDIGRKLEQIMLNSNIGQEDMAPIMGISQSMVSRIIRGEASLQLKQIEKISKHFNINSEYFSTNDKLTELSNTNSNTTHIMTEQAILAEFFEALRRKDEQINKLITLQSRLFDKLEEDKEKGEV
ncbi:MAG: helix-turn-helix transcriptional regulator [Bacteroidota bacterium]